MKLAFISPGQMPLPPVLGGSVETYMDKLIRELPDHEIAVYSGSKSKASQNEEYIGNIRHVRFPASIWQKYLQKVCQDLARHQPQVVQVDNRPGFIPSIVQASPNSKVILNLHSLNFVKNDKFVVYPIGFCLEKADLITVNSNYIAKKLHEMFPGLGTPVVTVHLGTDPGLFKSRWEPMGVTRRRIMRNKLGFAQKKVIMYAGRVIPTKGIHVLLQAMRSVARKHPKSVVIIVGGTSTTEKRQRAYVQKLRLMARRTAFKTIFLGKVSHQQMADYYLAADVLVCPSTGAEAFGLVNVEAMATGLPVVGSAIGGIPEVVSHQKSGLLVPPKSPQALSEALNSILKQPELARRFGTFGRKQVEDYYNWRRVAKQMEHHYLALVKRSVGGEAVGISQCINQDSHSQEEHQESLVIS